MESGDQNVCEESEDASSLCDEERIRKLFEACDGDGDGFIDSEDLFSVCRELNLTDLLEDLMHELGADENGRISYQEFLRRRLALKPEVEAIRSNSTSVSHHQIMPDGLPVSSNNSCGAVSASKQECWEFDSGARDLSPEPSTLQKFMDRSPGSQNAVNLQDLANNLQLQQAPPALKNEVLDLASRLHAATQIRDLLESALTKTELEKLHLENAAELRAQHYEERLTELHCVIAELSRKLERQRDAVIVEEDAEAGEAAEEREEGKACDGDVEEARSEDREEGSRDAVQDGSEEHEWEHDINDVESNTSGSENAEIERDDDSGDEVAQVQFYHPHKKVANKQRRKVRPKVRVPIEVAVADCVPVPSAGSAVSGSPSHGAGLPGIPREADIPVLKVAERVRLRKMGQPITGPEITAVGVSTTQVAEHLVASLAEESDLQELGVYDHARRHLEVETERLHSRLEHTRAQNNVLALSLEESKNQCDKLFLLLGKYESNAVALRLALGYADRATAAYDCLVALLETELALVLRGVVTPKDLSQDRLAAERAARSLLQAEQFGFTYCDGDWNSGEEKMLRELISQLKQDRSRVHDTVVELESIPAEPLSSRVPVSVAEARKLDLETAVLMQELMAMREDKGELRARLFTMEKERAALELRLSSHDTQSQAQSATIRHLQAQLQDMESRNIKAYNTPLDLEDDNDCQLRAALRREKNLKERMHELVSTLDKVSQRQEQSGELLNDLRRANSMLVESMKKSKEKYQSRLKKLEQKMLSKVERHSAQVRSFKERIGVLEQELESKKQPEQARANETSL